MGIPEAIKRSSSSSVGMKGNSLIALYFGISYGILRCSYKAFNIYAVVFLLESFHFRFANTVFTSSGSFRFADLDNFVNRLIALFTVDFAFPFRFMWSA